MATLLTGVLSAAAQTGASAATMASAVPGQSAAAVDRASPPVYDVATIKPNKTLSGSTDVDTNDATFKATNAPLKMLLQMAYGVKQEQISGMPGWAESAHYDIFAKALDADPELLKEMKRPEKRAMLRKLLESRFRIVSHIEVKTLPIFEMTVVKEGIKFREFVPKDSSDEGGDMGMDGRNHQVTMTARGASMSDVAAALSERVDHTVIDRTGLTGKYDMKLTWLRDDAPAGGDDAPPPILTALQEQLGLKLVAAKGPVNTLVIDSISLPTEN